MRHSEQIDQIAAALAQAQAEFPTIEKGRSANVGKYSYDYADLADVLAAVLPVLAKHGLALLQPPSNTEDGKVRVTTRILHTSGQWIEECFVLSALDPQDARSMGSAVTYARRYGLTGMLGIAPADGEDDDGAAARGGDHEMAAPAAPPPTLPSQRCPSCGADAILRGKPEYGGGWICFKKRGGCGQKWPDGPHPGLSTMPAKATASETDRIERAKLIGRIRAAGDLKRIGAEESQALWEKHCGGATPETADLAGLRALLVAVTT